MIRTQIKRKPRKPAEAGEDLRTPSGNPMAY
jgi:hypothetical protein